MKRSEASERMLADLTGRRHAILAGRGASAIYASLRAIGSPRDDGEVIVPAVICPSVAQAVQYAGYRPVFVDVDPVNFTITAGEVQRRLSPRTAAVIVVHLYGHVAAHIEQICSMCRPRGIFVIEDAAQAIGGAFQGRPLGSFGEVSVFSFDPTKIIAGVGGAVCTDDPGIADSVRATLASLPASLDPTYAHLASASARNLYHALVDALRLQPDLVVADAFQRPQSALRALYLTSFPRGEAAQEMLRTALEGLPLRLSARLAAAEAYDAEWAAQSGMARPSAWRESGVVWRYTVVVDDPAALHQVTFALRARGIHASNLYHNLAPLFGDDFPLPVADHLSSRLLNLWVDSTANAEYIRATGTIVSDVLASRRS